MKGQNDEYVEKSRFNYKHIVALLCGVCRTSRRGESGKNQFSWNFENFE